MRIITLKKNYEFKKVFNKGTYFAGKYVQAFIIKNEKPSNFLGLAISTKLRKSPFEK